MLKRHPRQKSFKLRWAIGSMFFAALFVAIGLVSTAGISGAKAQSPNAQSTAQPPTSAQIDRFLPAPKAHPLPASLTQRQTIGQQSGDFDHDLDHDYFDEVQPTIAGYLIWSQFPVRVYLEPATQAASQDRSQEWVTAVTAAIQEWNAYLPLTIVDAPDTADITIWRRTPPLQVDRSTARQPELRARSAETRFTLFVNRNTPASSTLSHRMTIWLGMGQTQNYLRAAARHELGHALGIWGHSSTPADVMYFSQVRQPPPISDRDINTLQRVYRQPTRLGWAIPQPSSSR
jgi:predicted Zn-dependent protease